MKNIKIDKNKCIGCGLCETIVPKAFRLNSKGKAEFVSTGADLEKKIKEAMDSCPVQAISK